MATRRQAVFICGFTFSNDSETKKSLRYPQLFNFKVTVTEKKEEEQVNNLGHTL